MDAALVTAWALVITAVGTLLTAVVGAYNLIAIKRVQHATDGMKDQLVNEVRQASFAAGKKEQKEDAVALVAAVVATAVPAAPPAMVVENADSVTVVKGDAKPKAS